MSSLIAKKKLYTSLETHENRDKYFITKESTTFMFKGYFTHICRVEQTILFPWVFGKSQGRYHWKHISPSSHQYVETLDTIHNQNTKQPLSHNKSNQTHQSNNKLGKNIWTKMNPSFTSNQQLKNQTTWHQHLHFQPRTCQDTISCPLSPSSSRKKVQT